MPIAVIEQSFSPCALAKRLGVHRQRLYAMIHAGKLRAEATSAGYAISKAECDRLIHARQEVIGTGGVRIVFVGFTSDRRRLRGDAQRKSSYRRGAAYPASTRRDSGPQSSEIV